MLTTTNKHSASAACMLLMGSLSLALLGVPAGLCQEVSPSVRSNIDETSGIGAKKTAPLTLSPLQPIPEGFEKLRLAPGFLLQMDVFGVPEMSTQLRLDEKGDVTVPLVGSVHIQGMTVPEAQLIIAKTLSDQEMLKNPQVTLNVIQFSAQNVTVLGEVQAPGRVQVLASVPLGNVLALVGGETVAAGNDIEIQHYDDKGALSSRHIEYSQGKDPGPLQSTLVDPGDTVLVHRAGIIYVLGAVNRPGGYLMVNGGTLSAVQAVSLAGGTTLQASNRWAVIVRRQGDGLVKIKVPLGKMEEGNATPIQLQYNDALFVPTSGWKVALINGSSVLSATAAAAVYKAP